MSGVERVDSWRTSDGEFFATEAEAQVHQDKIDFQEWFVDMINLSWPADMIAKEIWDYWHVTSRLKEKAL